MARLISHFHKLAVDKSPPVPQPDPLRAESPTPPAPPAKDSEPSAAEPPAPPPKSAKPTRPSSTAALIVVPDTPAEWKEVMEEVKGLYLKGQYKQCSARCKQILNGISDPYQIHPLRLIYLCFIAATSLELAARALHNNSSTKLQFFQESLSYFKKAQSYMGFAAFTTEPHIVRATQPKDRLSNSSISSSIRSSVDSIFSQSSESSIASSSVESPVSPSDSEKGHVRFSSVSSSTEIINPQPLRRKKKVSFSMHLPTLESETDLSSDDILARFPSPPTHDGLSPTILPTNLDSKIIPFVLSDNVSRVRAYSYPTNTSTPLQPALSPQEQQTPKPVNVPTLTHYRHNLSSFTPRLDYHIANIQAQIQTLTTVRRTHRSSLPNLFLVTPFPLTSPKTPDHNPISITTQTQTETETSQPAPSSSLHERIKRLKESGWKRERFDGEKYQVLCESALCEIEIGGNFLMN
ncbi:uncharacterized protein BP5553_07854 [Venustampulla echinocandica]|uniref:Uncharacterized protein n=1 Tax=Venustampulla echinocandica TaxID=2656787 RepID=A0A370THQ4_9HELO|nr:uncharacterized protein BP5553_07854 [Venustampulla echinocandica]RDL34726.1 hypothetical protein BP5553_07854 [Venustampulla echinocandica]